MKKREIDKKVLQLWDQCIEFKKNDIKFSLSKKDKEMAGFHQEVLKQMIKKYEQLQIEINGAKT